MRKACLTIFCFVILTNVFGQVNGSFFIDKNDFPDGLEISTNLEKHIYLENNDCLGHMTLSNAKKKVTYHVFDYSPTDSLIFKGILKQRLTMENCQWKGSRNPDKGIPIYFIKGSYYFLSEFCPCGSTSKGSCGDLAIKINKWLKRA
ncbi:MAG TPA: hypothetical protein PLJ60_03835 [Chryseolinea sp.]|nr:hypothetical protein [Chryseolinea sp.]